MGFFCWKIFCKTEQSSTHVAPNSGSVKLSHELYDLLCLNPGIQGGIRQDHTEDLDVLLVECSTFAKVLKNFSKVELKISHYPMVYM